MKKLLALVLALVMSMSLVTISNAAFKDADKIDYKEAVDVMNAVGVFIGDEKGNFNAKENLTREQAAKIIAYLELGSKAADALVGGATFTDVASTRWSAGFVGYCAQAGVVAGVGNSKFDPAGQLTALQFGKMLLVELGYDAKAAGMTGTDWAINTSKLMAKAKLMDGIDGSVNQVLTREKAAQMTLNALKAPTVEYDTKGSTITINGAVIGIGGCTALIIAGFGMRSSLLFTRSRQYDELFHYSAQVTLAGTALPEERAAVEDFLAGASPVVNYIPCAASSATVVTPSYSTTAYVEVMASDEIGKVVDLFDYKSGDPITMGDEGVYIDQKLSELLKVSVGDTFFLDGDVRGDVTVAGIYEHYTDRKSVV